MSPPSPLSWALALRRRGRRSLRRVGRFRVVIVTLGRKDLVNVCRFYFESSSSTSKGVLEKQTAAERFSRGSRLLPPPPGRRVSHLPDLPFR